MKRTGANKRRMWGILTIWSKPLEKKIFLQTFVYQWAKIIWINSKIQTDGETVETMTDFIFFLFFFSDFIFLGSKITAEGDCSHETERGLLLGRKVMTNLDSILKSRDIILPTKVHLVKDTVFPEIMYGCESWTIKKAECWRIYAFELWCWRRLLRVPWTERRSNQLILKEISPKYWLEGLMLKLKLQSFRLSV